MFWWGGRVGSMPDFFMVLHSILMDDERLLKRETVAIMFMPQLGVESRVAMNHIFADPKLSGLFIGEFPRSVELDWGIGGVPTRDGVAGGRRRGALVWSGMPNLFWVGFSVTLIGDLDHRRLC